MLCAACTKRATEDSLVFLSAPSVLREVRFFLSGGVRRMIIDQAISPGATR